MRTVEKVDLLIKGVQVYNSYFKKFIAADVWVKDGKFYYVDQKRQEELEAAEVVDATGRYMVPGLIDIHMHIESSMMTPAAISDQLVRCGITTIVSEPHEMANVSGVEGILDMIKAGENSPIDILYGIPSCVPSTAPELETTGGIMRCEDMERLKQNPAVACVGEVMNYRQVIKENHLEITKFLNKLRKEEPLFPIEGHCPELVDLDLAKFLYLGINGDHTEHTMEELRQQFQNGMFVEIQEKMLSKEVLDFIMENNLQEHFCFATDDVMADVLCEEGHLDALVRNAIKLGMPAQQAIYNASFTPARRMNLFDRGTIAPGKLADFVLLDSVDDFAVYATYKAGSCVYNRLAPVVPTPAASFPDSYYHSIRLAQQGPQVLDVKVDTAAEQVKVRVMEVCGKTTRVDQRVQTLPVKDGLLQWEGSDCMLALVFERYGINGNVGYGLLSGDCHKQGAIATSWAHDCHNILVVGSNKEDILCALNRVIQMQGGLAVANNNQVVAELQLNVGGILSDRPATEVGADLAKVRQAMLELGYNHYDPIMSFCTITLPVCPALKLTDMGLIDVTTAEVIPLVVD